MSLSALLSHLLVAFTIEFDNEFEHRMPHRTTRGRSGTGPWLVSLVMWSNCMRFVDEKGVRAADLLSLARTPTNLNGMERWGYVTVAPDPADPRPKPPRSAWLIRPTAKGLEGRSVWQPLSGEIEDRWKARFGADLVLRLRESLSALDARIGPGLPDSMPILGYGLFSRVPEQRHPPASPDSHPSLASLLSRPLLAFAIEFERDSELSLAIAANVLRVLNREGVRLRDLPRLSGVSKEAIRMALGILQKSRLAVLASDVRLTARGELTQAACRDRIEAIEAGWRSRYGSDTIDGLRHLLEQFAGQLFRGLGAYPDGWRASVPEPETLPHYPMVLHRGGFPDGS